MNTAWESEFVAFVHQRRAELVRWATTMTAGDGHLAEDLVQQTLTRVYRRWKQARRSPVAYSRRSLVNAFIDQRRRPMSRRERVVDAVPEGIAAPTGLLDAPVGVQSPDVELLDALRQLPPRMRAVITLRFVENLTVEETAEALGCATGTVKSQSARALAKLRETLTQNASATAGESTESIS